MIHSHRSSPHLDPYRIAYAPTFWIDGRVALSLRRSPLNSTRVLKASNDILTLVTAVLLNLHAVLLPYGCYMS